MTAHLVCILLVYSVAAAMVHLFYIRRAGRQGGDADCSYHLDNKELRYIVITSNHADRVEWVIRSLGIISWVHRRPLSITVLDNESVDDTLPILQRMLYSGSVEMAVISSRFSPEGPNIPQSYDANQIIIDLRMANQRVHIPFAR